MLKVKLIMILTMAMVMMIHAWWIVDELYNKNGGCQRYSSTYVYHIHLPKHSLMNCIESSRVLTGNPTTVSPPSSNIHNKFDPRKAFTCGKFVDLNLLVKTWKFENHDGGCDIKLDYGFWDESMIQTGFPSLVDFSILVAKYLSGFECIMLKENNTRIGVMGPCNGGGTISTTKANSMDDFKPKITKLVKKVYQRDQNCKFLKNE
ncbi:hypothetical protein LXL04_012519 [Taraxacum kok-saghyz]